MQALARDQCTEIAPPLRPLDTSSNVQFKFEPSSIHQTDLSQLYMNIAISLVKADGTTPVEHRKNLTDEHYLNPDTINFKETTDTNPGAEGADSALSCSNNLLHSIFDECELKLKGRPVERVNDYGYVAYVQNLLGWSEVAKKNVLPSTLGWIDDDADLFDSANNTAFEKRVRHLLLNGRTLYLKGKLSLGCSEMEQPLPTHLPIEIELRRKNADFVLIDTKQTRAAAPTYKIKIHDINLEVKRLGLTPAELRVQEEQLKKGIPYTFYKTECRSYVASSGHPEFNVTDLESGPLPDRIMMAMVDNAAYHGDWSKNPFRFQTYDCSAAWITVNGSDKIPSPVGYTWDRSNSRTLDGYLELYQGGNFHALKMKDYLGGSFLLTFDLRKHLSGSNSVLENGTVSAHLRFDKALPHTMTLLAFIIRPCQFIMDQHRNVTLNYTP